jgi:hypothetical protein
MEAKMKIPTLTIVALVALTASISANRETSKPDSLSGVEIGVPPTPAATPGLEGYCWPLSAARGESIDFYISGSGSPSAEFFNLTASSPPAPSSRPLFTMGFVPTEQRTNVQPWRNGAGWKVSFTLTVPFSTSGLWAVRLTDLNGVQSYIPFVVKPGPDHSDLAVIVNVNTWLAYNNWGGRSKEEGAAHVSFMRPNRAISPVAKLADSGHLLQGELWILKWLWREGMKPNVFTDIDFESGAVLRGGYRRLIISTHPEYWTREMYKNVKMFLGRGGSILYLGGNGIYENAEYEFTATNKGMIFRDGVEDGAREKVLFRRLWPPRPERTVLGLATERCRVEGGPYEVIESSHPLFAGTGLRNGDILGDRGLNTGYGNGKASGWVIDTSNGDGAVGIPRNCDSDISGWPVPAGPGLPPGLTVLARGRNWLEEGRWHGAEMVYYRHACGGSVFSVGSIAFGGSLMVDPKLQQIVLNTFRPPVGTARGTRLGEIPLEWKLAETRIPGTSVYRITLPGQTFEETCGMAWFQVVGLPSYYTDPYGRDACNVQFSVIFPSGVRLTRVIDRGDEPPLEVPFPTSPAIIRSIWFSLNQLVFRAEPLSARRTYDLTFEFLVPSEGICRSPDRP